MHDNRKSRRLKIAAMLFLFMTVVVAAAAWKFPLVRRFPSASILFFQEAPVLLPVPVAGVSLNQLVDTWGGIRSEGRRHEGIDIFAPQDTEIRSTTDGIVCTIGENRLGGHVVSVFGPGGYWHYYAHLHRFANLREGDVIKAGTVVGYVGDTGNAKGTPYHLHYGVYTPRGNAINPYPLLVNQKVADGR